MKPDRSLWRHMFTKGGSFLSLLVVGVAVLALSACDVGLDEPIFSSPDGLTPRAGAIEIRDPSNIPLGFLGPGSYRCGVLSPGAPAQGTASEGRDSPVPLMFNVGQAYPNPALGVTTLEFSLTRDSQVAVFVVPAVGPLEPAPDPASSAQGASIFLPGGRAIEVLRFEALGPGMHIVTWVISDSTFDGRPLPYGYYRVYLQTEHALGCWDVLYTPHTFFD